jgi:hypothetical protein
VRYSAGEKVHALLFVNGKRRYYSRARESGVIRWGVPLPAGRYRLQIAVEDRAGNVSPRADAGTVRIRYIELARNVIRAGAGLRFGVGVATNFEVVNAQNALTAARLSELRKPSTSATHATGSSRSNAPPTWPTTVRPPSSRRSSCGSGWPGPT